MSEQVRVVEDMLGYRLFFRRGRGVEATPAGRVFVEEAKYVLAVAERAVSRARAAASGGEPI